MSVMSRHPLFRWLAPVAVVAVVAGSALVGQAVASGTSAADLPEVSAQQLLTDVARADVAGVSGTVVESADLGLPSLPRLGSSGTQLLDLLTGTHTLRVWYGGQDQQRVALLDSLGESDIIHDGRNVWIWGSSDNSATHWTLPAGKTHPAAGDPASSLAAIDPQRAAAAALALIGKTTTVTVGNSAVVAGRRAYELILRPKGTGSLIAAVRIAVDGATFVPLRVQVDSTAMTTPAFSVGFTSVTFGKPDPSEFAFTPPPGATVTDGQRAGLSGVLGGLPQWSSAHVVGSGWTSVIVADQQSTDQQNTNGQHTGSQQPTAGGSVLERLAQSLPRVSGSWGSGRLLSGSVFTLVITDDHQMAIGATTPQVVYRALARS